ncbi:Variant surface glycoprotein [Trypanosoma congolense IL3000]|uniref:Variant surface glycoprotein n=1 Tax=Trypanosoma congolense (strain IL3000) TaxID=1068625 RepID=F9W4Q8_TRYCI|nr:Variant surface glycoprotein [Trypanosoma congolense IL3000]CCD16671.1 Variant surface glycoprotein [Trypanosoma congolense IL3000]
MKIQFLVFICAVVAVSGAEDGGAVVPRDHNKDEYHRLCNLMKAAVTKWGDGGQGLSEPLKKALGRTLFGNDKGGDLGQLKGVLPSDYNDVEDTPDSRGLWCGDPREGDYIGQNQARWSGHSAPHDMVCLCTAGEKGWPVNRSETSTEKDKLCGQDRTALKAESNQGWGYTRHTGNAHVDATWKATVTHCLDGDGKGEGLKVALGNFIEKLKPSPSRTYPSREQLGEGNATDSDACSGSSARGVCVMYYTNMKPTPWWKVLQEALIDDEKIQAEKRREEEEKRKQQEEERKTDESHEENITSSETTTQGTEKNRIETLHEAIRKYNTTSGTPISLPSSWLLSAVFLF